MKRIIALMLVTFMLGCAVGVAEPVDEQPKNAIGIQRGTEITVGSTTELSGYFSTDMWGNNAADMDVRALLHGYSTVSVQGYLMMVDTTVVSNVSLAKSSDGNQLYTLTLSDALYYNDGTRITAKDYVFSLLMCGSPVIEELDGSPRDLTYIIGYDTYGTGETSFLAGLRLLSDNSFSIEIKPEYQKYFYDMELINVTPYPLSVIAPGCDVYDDGQGAYIGPAAEAASMNYTPGEFGDEMLRKTLLDPQTGYVFNPRVTSGPYTLVSYDAATHVAAFKVNELYVGNCEGEKPHIERIVFQPVNNGTMLAQLANGEVSILNKVADGSAIGEGFALVQEQNKAQLTNYLRSGFTFLSFACEQGVTASENVRKAVAHCIDKSAFVSETLGNATAIPVYGYYGLGQWMATVSFPEDPEQGLAELNPSDELAMLEVPYDLDAAAQLLIEDGWTLNVYGEPYQAGVDEIRYRDENGELVPLMIRWAKAEGNAIADAVEQTLHAPFETLGIGLEVNEMLFSQMLKYYYRQVDRTYDMFFLASNFGYAFDPYTNYHSSDEYQGILNTTGLKDEELEKLAQDMRNTYPSEIREYTEKWLAFQHRWVELMPMVPLYTNVYFDFYARSITDYNPQLYTSWAYAIVYAWIDESDVSDEAAYDDQDELLAFEEVFD